jgi:hypothetical protein
MLSVFDYTGESLVERELAVMSQRGDQTAGIQIVDISGKIMNIERLP